VFAGADERALALERGAKDYLLKVSIPLLPGSDKFTKIARIPFLLSRSTPSARVLAPLTLERANLLHWRWHLGKHRDDRSYCREQQFKFTCHLLGHDELCFYLVFNNVLFETVQIVPSIRKLILELQVGWS
jgi:hypothetical protein